MIRNRLLFIVLTLLFLMVACAKKEEVTPPPAEPAPTPTDTTEEIRESEPPPVQEVSEPDTLSDFDLSQIDMDDVYFDFDKANLRSDAIAVLQRHAEVLKANPEIKVLVEGHCDERGTNEYNIGLGERRASRVREYLVSLGIDSSRLKTISYGEERPKAMGHNEEAWAKNRRAHFNLSK